jgi:hypothetical protein
MKECQKISETREMIECYAIELLKVKYITYFVIII